MNNKYKNKYNTDNKYNNSKYNNKNNVIQYSQQELEDQEILKINDDEYNEGLSKQELFKQDDYRFKYKNQKMEESMGYSTTFGNTKSTTIIKKQEEEKGPVEEFTINLQDVHWTEQQLQPFKKRFIIVPEIKASLDSFEFINGNSEFTIENIEDQDDYQYDVDDDEQDKKDRAQMLKDKKAAAIAAIAESKKSKGDKVKEYFPNNQFIPIASTGDDECLPNQMKLFFKKTEFLEPTLFQKYAWPAILTGYDIIGTSLPGSGKTLGYLAPMIPHVLARMDRGGKNKITGEKMEKKYTGILVLVLVPTRELGLQVHSNASLLTTLFGVKSNVIYGGIQKSIQVEQLQKDKPHILIATPGRLIEMIGDGTVDVSTVTMLVLDEADKMLSKGLLPQLKQIRGQIRPDSQNILFSATFPESMKEVSKCWIKDPSIRLRIGSSELPKLNRIEQEVQLIAHHKKPRALIKLLGEPQFREAKKTIIFFNKIKELKRISIMLLKSNIKHDTIFGNIDQEKREKLIQKFSSSRTTLLLSTDIIGRGIHIDDIYYIVNYDFPRSLEQYCHRVGRAGRTDKVVAPKAYSLLTSSDSFLIESFVQFLKDQNQKIDIPFLKQCNEKFGFKFEFTLSKRKLRKLSKKTDEIDRENEEFLLAKYDKLIKKDKENDSDNEKFDNSDDSDEDTTSKKIKKNKNKKIKH